MFSFAWGRLSSSPNCGRRPIILIAALAHIFFFSALLVWYPLKQSFFGEKWEPTGSQRPGITQYAQVWGLACAFGLADAVWETFPYAILQGFFASDDVQMNAANANLKLWQSLGVALQFVLGLVFGDRQRVNLAIIFSTLVVGLIGLFILDTCVEQIDTNGRKKKMVSGERNWEGAAQQGGEKNSEDIEGGGAYVAMPTD